MITCGSYRKRVPNIAVGWRSFEEIGGLMAMDALVPKTHVWQAQDTASGIYGNRAELRA